MGVSLIQLWVFLLSLILYTTAIAQDSKTNVADSLYRRAEVLYNLANPTEVTDRKAIENYHEAIRLYGNEDDYTLILADCYQKIGIIYQDKGETDKALENYYQAVKTKQKIQQNADSLYFKELILIGNVHFLKDRYDSAEHYYLKAADIAESYDSLNHLVRLYNSTGALYQSVGNYQQANNYFRKALASLDTNERDYQRDKANFENNIAITELSLGNHKRAIAMYKEILEDNISFPALYHNLGDAYTAISSYDSAKYYYYKAIDDDHLATTINAYNKLAKIYNQQERTDSVIFYLKKSLDANSYSPKNTLLSETYAAVASVSEMRENYDSALYYYQKAIIANTFNFNDENITQNPGREYQPVSILYQSKILQNKGEVFIKYYEQNQDTTNLRYALDCFREAIRVARYTQRTYDNEEAKLFFVNQVHALYADAIRTAYLLYQLSEDNQYAELALQLSEKSKASVLTEILREVDIKASGEVNDSLINHEKLIKQQITANRLKLVESSDSAQNEAYRQKINDLEISLARVVKLLQQDEKYYQLKYQEDSIDLSAWQATLLSEDDLLLEYFISEDNLYIFAVDHDVLMMEKVALDSTFRTVLKNVQNHLFAYNYGDDYQKQWSNQLYQKLIEPVAEAVSRKKRLIIIPSGELSYLPFEMLAKDEQSDKYLLHDYTVSYAFSGTLLYDAHLRESAEASDQQVLAMAPFAGRGARSVRDNTLSPLYFSRQEVNNVGGSLYLGEQATKQLFLEVAGSYNILHLATHASVNDENPLQSFIAFYPQDDQSIAGYRLYTHELYNLRLDSVNLVVLSSCDAGNGRLVKGEGIISLARAFAYAGCPNIVTTLWKADDKAAADIASQMHYYLKNGYAKDAALRQAKLDYLNDPESKELRTPYYWANFVFIGDPAPIYDNYSWVGWMVMGIAFLLIVGILVLIKQRRIHHRQNA